MILGPNDCFVDDGESYRGNASETDDGDECLHWNSHFILEKGLDPFNSFEDTDGLGRHNRCRSGYTSSMLEKVNMCSQIAEDIYMLTQMFSMAQEPRRRLDALVFLQKRP